MKRFFRENGRVRLQPENDALEPIYAQHVQLLGKVIGVFRAAVSVAPLNRTLEQELFALAARREPRVPRLRRVRAAGAAGARCPECGTEFARRSGGRAGLQLTMQAG